LDRCDICRDAAYHLACDRDGALLVNGAHRVGPSVPQHLVDSAAGSSDACR
jgi:hypothetical protein